MNYYLGVDIGTTSTKTVAFSDTGDVIADKSVAYDMQHPQPGWSEQDPDEIFEAVIKSINEVIKSIAPHPPQFVSFSAVMHSVLAVNDKGQPLSPCIIWADNRAERIAEQLRKSYKGTSFYQTTGVPIHAMSPLCKLVWLKEQQPSVFQAAYKFIGIKEYIFYKLFGTFVVDTSIASATGLLNIQTLRWDKTILNFLEIDASRLSNVVPSKHVLQYNQTQGPLSIQQTTPFVIGASDGALSSLASSTVSAHAMAVTIGTSGAVRLLLTTPQTDRRRSTFCYHVKDNYYIIGGATNNGAVVIQWLKEQLLQTQESYEALFDQAATVAPGSQGLLFLPYILGERAPVWNSSAQGVYFGLSIHHTKAHLVRACVEGMIYNLYVIGKTVAGDGQITELHASGGFAKNKLGLQIMADVFNTRVLVSGAVESSSLGAVVLGAEALGITTGFQSRVLASYDPNPANHKVYRNQVEKFERLYEILKGEMKPEDPAR